MRAQPWLPVALIWAAFGVAHAVSVALGFVWPNGPMGDTYLVYEPWSEMALGGYGIVGVDMPWVYPPLALAPMVIAQGLVWFESYSMAWAALVCIANAVGFWALVRDGESRSRVIAGGYWALFTLLLGPIAIYRIDAITVPLAVIGMLWLRSRPGLAGAVLSIATWIKVWPAALLLAAVCAVRRRKEVVIGAALASVVIAGVVVLAGGAGNLFGFVTEQTGRGLQIEAVAATPFMVMAQTGSHAVYYDTDILTYQVAGPGIAEVASAMTLVMVIAVAGIAALGTWKSRRGASVVELLPPLALALVTALIVTNKVGSPQFESWFIAPIVWWIVWDRRRAMPLAILALVIAALTHVIYPLAYTQILLTEAPAIAVLVLRNVALVALGIWAVVRVVRVPARG
ncbi:glycosyltransferase 87 family protein [Microbacterium amylolyticum]|uniref:DUF2029 domain-containing protein n=1 Tax=Microbacterium amylolyticum TaxID=936337 RepID=A0ABS4ZG93_9MICO|nr:glycosyltransferase 87 family protein [Microbacterium amylolyticum]MBP2436296.1 hypothetical protein [Microbacterium amylolyticum]